MQKTIYKVADFISWQKSNSLELAPKFQRRPRWSLGAKSFLIDTIVKNFPIPIIFLRDVATDLKSLEPTRQVIDGQQRLRTVISFVSPQLLNDFDQQRDAFTIKKAHNPLLAGRKFEDLDTETRRAILDYEFSVHVLPSNIDDRVVIQIFRRMNATSYSLTPQEHRNANFYGEFKSCAYSLAEEQLHRWRKWGVFTEDDIARMAEVEFTSECILFILEGKLSGKSKPHIDKAYRDHDEKFPDRMEVERRFRFVMEQVDVHFGSDIADFVFFKKTLIYTFLAFMYDTLIGLETPLTKKPKWASLRANQVAVLGIASKRIKDRSGPKRVLAATDRRTTNPKERTELFAYLKNFASHA